MRTACTCRAYPDPDQQLLLARTFGRVRVVWNRALPARNVRWATQTRGPLRLAWSWAQVDLATLDPTTVTAARDPDGRWYATLHVEVADPVPPPPTGRAVGIDLGVTDFAVLSTGERIANPRHLARKGTNLARAIVDTGWGTFRAMPAY